MPAHRTRLQGWTTTPPLSIDTSQATLEGHMHAFRSQPSYDHSSQELYPGDSGGYHTFPQDYPTSAHSSNSREEIDPSWVPRPANCFILFRSEFSKLHCRANSDGDAPLDKTLSKRAAEKWRTMTPQEKQKYQKMAEAVRAEHAELYPNYRFHPAKRSTQKKRKNQFPSRCPIPRRASAPQANISVAAVPSMARAVSSSHSYASLHRIPESSAGRGYLNTLDIHDGELRYPSSPSTIGEHRAPSHFSPTPELSSTASSPHPDHLTISPHPAVAALPNRLHMPTPRQPHHFHVSSTSEYQGASSQWNRPPTTSITAPYYPVPESSQESSSVYVEDMSIQPVDHTQYASYGGSVDEQWGYCSPLQQQSYSQLPDPASDSSQPYSGQSGLWSTPEEHQPPGFADFAADYIQFS